MPTVKDLERTSSFYDDMQPKWESAWTHYRSDIDELRSATYLLQREQAESDEQHTERTNRADYTPLFSAIVLVYAGKILALEHELNRRFQREESEDGLGDPEDRSTLAGRLVRNVDGAGMNWRTMVARAAVRLTALHEIWVLVEGVERTGDGQVIQGPTAHLVLPQDVLDYQTDKQGRLEWVKVVRERDVRSDWTEEENIRKRYTIFRREGFEVYEKPEDSSGDDTATPVTADTYGPGEDDSFRYYASERQRQEVLPIFRIRLGMDQFVGHLLAEKNNVIFNQESERDNILLVANTPRRVWAGDFDEYKKHLEAISNSRVHNVLFESSEAAGGHRYIAPPTGSAQIATEVLKDKITNFFVSAFQFYQDAAQGSQKTATQIRQESAAEESYLATLATALDEMEQGIGRRIEQIQFPSQPSLWGQFGVERPMDFDPLDPEEEADKLIRRYFPNQPPIDTETAVNVMTEVLELDGIEYDEDELRTKVQQVMDREAQAASVASDFNI